MKFTFLKRWKFWKRFMLITIGVPILLFSLLILYVYIYQDDLVQAEVEAMNKQHKGLIVVGDSHLAPFANFPYISIKIDDVRIYESKKKGAEKIMDVKDIYLGFNMWDIVGGNYDIQELLIEDGFFNIVRHKDGSLNIQNALAKPEDAKEEEEPMDVHLKKIKLRNLDIHKLDEASMLDVETFIHTAEGGFQTGKDKIKAHIDTKFELNIIENHDTSFIKHKHFEFHTDVVFNEKSGKLDIKPSGIKMEHGDFEIEGSYNTKDDLYIDLDIRGKKPNFDMIIAFAPEDIIPVLEEYNNAGKIYFNASIKGNTKDEMPAIVADFGADEAYMENTTKGKRLDELGFKGHFSNGEERTLESMEFSITNLKAKPDKGEFIASVFVKDFTEPDVKLDLHADFNLEFLAAFFNLNDIQDMSGNVKLDMQFHDIIDLEHPERALNELNQAYSSELKISNLKVKSKELPAPIHDLDLNLAMEGKKGVLKQCDLKIGKSDIGISGYLSDLPAVIHHSSTPIHTELHIKSKMLDLAELTGFSAKDSTGIDEQIEDFKMDLAFESSARAFTESKYLPHGEFFVDDLHAQLKHYPHELHDFHIDVLVDERDLKIVDFTGFIDESDFHFNGDIHDYGFWMQETLEGDVNLDITLESEALHLEDIFSYQGENYVPEDYRHEEFDKLKLHVNTAMHFKDSELHSIDIDLDRFDAKMYMHHMRFEDFMGRVHYEDDHVMIEKFHGKMGRTVFDLDMNYYIGDDPSIRKRDNHLGLNANYIDFDQLFSFNEAPKKASNTSGIDHPDQTTDDVAQHAEAFNIYELPFTDMTIDVDIGHFIYHTIDLQNIHTRLRTTQNHYIYVDTLRMNAAGGSIRMSGYFNGSDPQHIYLDPNLKVRGVDLDKLLFKFENFGQDEVVAENLHGKLNAHITGHIRVYPDMVTDLDQSEIHMDVEVLNGRLENYEPVLMLSDYMGDKDLTNVRFDTLKNHMDITNGVITIPNMTIESTLGHYELSGTQSMAYEIDYYFRIPWSTIKQGARYRIFGEKKTKDGETGDDQIIEKDPNGKTRYLNVHVVGTLDHYDIKLEKKKGN
jgi:hypothetical protein